MGRWNAALRLIGVGFYIGGSIVLGVVAGRWLDSKLNTEPILVIVGLVFGLFMALAARDPVKFKNVIYVGVVLFAIRVLQRIFFFFKF